MKWFTHVSQNTEEQLGSGFTKHGFEKRKDESKKICVKIKESTYQFDYETNKLYEIPSENIKFAICISGRELILFINKGFIPGNDTTSPYRTFYEGLMKEPFKLCYPFNEQVIIEAKKGNRFVFSIVNAQYKLMGW